MNFPNVMAQLTDRHILKRMPEPYVTGFARAVSTVFAPAVLEDRLQQRFFIPNDRAFSLETYLESAAELSVQFHLATHPAAQGFCIDKQVHPPKDVDAYYEVGCVRVSLEVKCPRDPEDASDGLSLRTAGRIPGHVERCAELERALVRADPPRSVRLGKNRDNSLKDFLVSAHSKFSPTSSVSDLNVLFIACGGRRSMQQWYLYLKGRRGLFTRDPFVPAPEFELVDLVVLSNLKYCHLSAPAHHDWTLQNTLLVPILNPAARRSRASESVICGLEVFEHHLKRFGEYRRSGTMNVPDYVRDAVKMNGFVLECLDPEELARYFPAGVDR